MTTKQELTLETVIQKALGYDPKDIDPLLKYLGLDKSELRLSKTTTENDARIISRHLRKMGSNDIATLFRSGDGVPYSEVVYDVGRKLKVPGITEGPASFNEKKIIEKLFADALDKMTEEERRQLMASIGISSKDIPFGSSGVIITQFLLKEFGGFAVYKSTLIVANLISRALLGSGLSFATNAAITRTIGVALGPVGWIVSGAWLAVDLAGPAYRKTVPAVIHVAMLRQMLQSRVVVGVVGEGSVGKDALLKAVFSIDTNNVNPVAGSTSETEIYNWDPSGRDKPTDVTRVVNFPGFNDINRNVNDITADHLNHADIFLMVVDINRGISDVEVQSLKQLSVKRRPILVCLNKVDLPRPDDKGKLVEAAKARLKGENVEMLETAFDPDPRLHDGLPIGVLSVGQWVIEQLKRSGKNIF
ncbi:TPA: 50S ribosome-binding GTPase [Vibrio parahaemolyticus]|nr:50S ribosome-binding GTPase [Vibrio parahaemolyticus]